MPCLKRSLLLPCFHQVKRECASLAQVYTVESQFKRGVLPGESELAQIAAGNLRDGARLSRPLLRNKKAGAFYGSG